MTSHHNKVCYLQTSEKSKTRWLSSDANELFEKLKLLLQEKQAGKNSNLITVEIVAMTDKLLEHKCIST